MSDSSSVFVTIRLYRQALPVKHKFNADANDSGSITISEQICCQSIIIQQAISCCTKDVMAKAMLYRNMLSII